MILVGCDPYAQQTDGDDQVVEAVEELLLGGIHCELAAGAEVVLRNHGSHGNLPDPKILPLANDLVRTIAAVQGARRRWVNAQE